MMEKIKIISDWEVLTPTGWNDFIGIKRVESECTLKIVLSNGLFLEGAANHKILIDTSEYRQLSELLIGQILPYYAAEIVDIIKKSNTVYLYDLLNVSGGNVYYTNDIVSHNCGVGNKFHQIWQQAQEGVSSDGLEAFNPILLPWYLHPERDQTWRDQQDALLGKRLASQECDANFLSSGHTVIESELLEFYEEKCVDPIEKRGIGGDLWIWKYPDYNKSYVVVADPSRGDGEDYSGCVVMEVENVEIVAEYKGKIDTQAFGRTLVSLATEYNQALLVIDNRNIGWSTIQVAIDLGYRNLYYSYKNDPYLDENIHLRKNYDLKNKEDMVPGLTTTTRNRPVYISKLEMYFREKTPIIYSKRLINELRVFMWVDGKPQAQRGYNDDLVMSLSMAFYIRDTALRMRQMGIELVKNALTKTHKTVFKSKPIGESYWEMNTGRAGNKESLRWLL